MIDPHSASYPILGAALASGVEPRLAYQYVDANYRLLQTGQRGERELAEIIRIYVVMMDRYPPATVSAFQERVEAAALEGRIYWPFPDWLESATNRLQIGARRPMGIVEDDEPDNDPPPQPEPIP